MGLEFRFAERGDCGLILGFIKALAEYEKMTDAIGAALCSTAVGASAALKNREQVVEFIYQV